MGRSETEINDPLCRPDGENYVRFCFVLGCMRAGERGEAAWARETMYLSMLAKRKAKFDLPPSISVVLGVSLYAMAMISIHDTSCRL